MKRRLRPYEDECPVADTCFMVLYNRPAVGNYILLYWDYQANSKSVLNRVRNEIGQTPQSLKKYKPTFHFYEFCMQLLSRPIFKYNNTLMGLVFCALEQDLCFVHLKCLNANKNLFGKENSH